jgi:hypothetical protein
MKPSFLRGNDGFLFFRVLESVRGKEVQIQVVYCRQTGEEEKQGGNAYEREFIRVAEKDKWLRRR